MLKTYYLWQFLLPNTKKPKTKRPKPINNKIWEIWVQALSFLNSFWLRDSWLSFLAILSQKPKTQQQTRKPKKSQDPDFHVFWFVCFVFSRHRFSFFILFWGPLRVDNCLHQWERVKEVSRITLFLDPLTNCLVMSYLQFANMWKLTEGACALFLKTLALNDGAHC